MRKALILILLVLLVFSFSSGIYADEVTNDNLSETSAQGASVALYKVVSGDTLASIATRFGVDKAKLADTNGLSASAILVEGQVLVISEEPLDDYYPYTVIPGDTIYTIAASQGVSAGAIVNLNRLSDYGAGLEVGQTIVIPYPVEPEAPDLPVNDDGDIEALLSYAKNLLGKGYVYGDEGPDTFDCSGFTYYVFQAFGVTLPRESRVQATAGVYVKKENLLPGDLVFFSTSSSASVGHVGIYLGNNEFIHAANSARGVCTDSLTSTYYTNHYVTARRVQL